MRVFSSLLTILSVGLYGKLTNTENCTEKSPILTPPSLLVEYGSPAEVNCSIPKKPVTRYLLGWESKTSQTVTENEMSVVWKVDSLTQWEEAEGLQCYFTVERTQCVSHVNLTIYKKPDNVTLSSDVWVEGSETQMRCEIENVGPGSKLSVLWSRADPMQRTFIQFSETLLPGMRNETKNLSKTVNLTVTASREDDGAQYWCAAVLNLENHRKIYTSQPITITVHSDDKTYILVLVLVIIVVLLVVVTIGCWTYYRRTHMGQYILRQLRAHRNSGYIDHKSEDQGQL